MKNALLPVLFLFLAVSAFAQTADEIIDNHLKAIGGKAWENIKTVKTDAKITAQAAPGMEIPMTMTIVHNKAARIDVTVMGMTQSSCINGDGGWANNPFMGKTEAEPITADQAKEMKEMTDLSGSLYNYKAKGYKVEYVGQEDLEGTEVHKIKVEHSPTKTEYVLIDPSNWYQIKNITVTTVDGQEVTSESMFSNFKEVSGVIFPFTIEQNNPMMGSSVVTVTNVAVNEPVDEQIFVMLAK
ncbi:MAG: hypothetical protein IT260_09100 [Saprospiraceae bacterium]|nr:hypothetical protein [Saprospiraceae bacterium]